MSEINVNDTYEENDVVGIVGPDENRVFEIIGVFGEHKAYVGDKMLDFMIKNRDKNEQS